MIVAIHQPNYLPWIGFFDKLDQADHFVLLDTAMHSKNSFTNRNKVKTPQGTFWLTVPLSSKQIPINELQIDNSQNWQEKHWRTIESNYKKCKYWSLYATDLKNIYRKKWDQLADLNAALIFLLKKLLNISTKISFESQYNRDFGKSSQRNINIVKHLGGTTYLSGIGAKAYNDEAAYKAANLTLIYQNFKHPSYPQQWGEFIEKLSILDILFNCGPEAMTLIRQERS